MSASRKIKYGECFEIKKFRNVCNFRWGLKSRSLAAENEMFHQAKIRHTRLFEKTCKICLSAPPWGYTTYIDWNSLSKLKLILIKFCSRHISKTIYIYRFTNFCSSSGDQFNYPLRARRFAKKISHQANKNLKPFFVTLHISFSFFTGRNGRIQRPQEAVVNASW